MERKITNTAKIDIKPKNLEECFDYLTKNTPYANIKEFKQTPEREAIVRTHDNTGRFIRNHWELWKWDTKNELVKYFNNLGIYHPDDMSCIILTSLHRHLNSRKIKLEKQVKHYRDYWSLVGPKVNERKIQ